jgi:hypothetical protein
MGLPRHFFFCFKTLGTGQSCTNNIQTPYGKAFKEGDVIGVAVDFTNASLTFYLNGVSLGVCYKSISGPVSFACSLSSNLDEVKMKTKLPFPKGKNSFLTPSSNVLASNGNLNLRYKVNGVAETFFTTEVMTTGVHYLFVFLN